MAEKPILFSAPMVRALLAGAKTQTRRPVKPQPPQDVGAILSGLYHPTVVDRHGEEQPGPETFGAYSEDGRWAVRCPYGQPGDRLWVRESWAPDPPDIDGWGYATWAGCREGRIAGVPERFRNPRHCVYEASWPHAPMRWTPSIHMPRWASRIVLEITAVRVERLQDISEADAIAEGIAKTEYGFWSLYGQHETEGTYSPRSSFRALWQSINGPGSWDANPWVWAVTFATASPVNT